MPSVDASPPPASLQTLISTHPQFTRSRLFSLYSDFRPLVRTNPDGYSANVSAWLSLLTDAAKHGLLTSSPSPSPSPSSSSSTYSPPDTLVLTVNAALISSFARDDVGRPLAIGAVVSDALRSKSLIPLSTFLSQSASIYSTPHPLLSLGGWVLSKVPIIGGFTTSTTPSISEDAISRHNTQYVLLSNLESCARSILETYQSQHRGLVSQIFTIDSFLSEFRNPLLPQHPTFSEKDLQALLTYLSRDLPSLTRSSDGKIIKFHPPNSTTTAQEITPTDITIANLKSTIAKSHATLTHLETHSAQLSLRAKCYLAKSQKPAALATLKAKKLVDEQILQRLSSLNQLEALRYQLESAADNLSLLSLLESGGKALKEMNIQMGGVEKVDEVLEQVREAGEDAEEIRRVVERGLGGEEWVDEQEVEGELEEMVREEKENEVKRREEQELVKRLGGLGLEVPERELEKRQQEGMERVIA